MHRLTLPTTAAAAIVIAPMALASDLTLEPAGDVTTDLHLTPEVAMAALQDAPDLAEATEESAWTFKVTAGGSASFGNSDTQDAFVTGEAVRDAGDDQRTTVGAGYFYGAADGDRTDNRFILGVRHEWLMSDSPWSYFAQAKYEYDEFQSWEHRVSGAVGVGYTFIDREDLTVIGRLGLGGSQEFNSPDDDFKPEALIGAELRYDLSDATELVASTEIFPDLGEAGEFRSLSRAGIKTLLDEELNMSFTLGLEHEYQSEAAPPADKNDFRILAGLQFEF